MNLSRLSVGRAGPSLGRAFGGISAIGTKELRGRMRGRRAFVAMTFYLGLLGFFAWMLETLQASAFQNAGFGSATYQSSQIGTGIFAGLLILQTLLVLVLAPAFTAGAISQEREKQTLDLLVTTPISSLSIVLGKLFSALAWAFLLVIASIPLTAIVFVFGGVAPEDLVRGYVVLLIEALGLGCVGLFFSALLKRTLAATIVTYSIVLAMTVGASFVYVYVTATGQRTDIVLADGSTSSHITMAPEALLWFNPFVADMDVLCPTGTGIGGTCTIISTIMGQDQSINGRVQVVGGGVVVNGQAVPQPAGVGKVLPDGSLVMPDGSVVSNGGGVAQQPVLLGANDPIAGPSRDSYWPRSAAAWLVVSVILVLLSVNLVSPTRRWRLRLGLRRRGSGSLATAPATLAVAPATLATAPATATLPVAPPIAAGDEPIPAGDVPVPDGDASIRPGSGA